MTKYVLEEVQLFPGVKPDSITVRVSPEFSIHIWSDPEKLPGGCLWLLQGVLQLCARLKRCQNCGFIFEPGRAYCPKCGQKLPADEIDSADSADGADGADTKSRKGSSR